MSWILIRHGMTEGNKERRYVGCRTDEPLCAEGTARLEKQAYPEADRVFVSPMKRCLETATILYPTIKAESSRISGNVISANSSIKTIRT